MGNKTVEKISFQVELPDLIQQFMEDKLRHARGPVQRSSIKCICQLPAIQSDYKLIANTEQSFKSFYTIPQNRSFFFFRNIKQPFVVHESKIGIICPRIFLKAQQFGKGGLIAQQTSMAKN